MSTDLPYTLILVLCALCLTLMVHLLRRRQPPVQPAPLDLLHQAFPEAEISYFKLRDDGTITESDSTAFEAALGDSAPQAGESLRQLVRQMQVERQLPYPVVRKISQFTEN